MKSMFYLFSILSGLLCSCLYSSSEKSYTVEAANVKAIKIVQMSENEITGEILIENPNDIKLFISGINENRQFLTKFLPTYKAEIYFKNNEGKLQIMFRENYFKVHPGGTFKMTKSITEILEKIETKN